MKIFYRQAAADDAVRQFRYYLITLNVPDVAIRFQNALRQTMHYVCEHPFVGPRCPSNNSQLERLQAHS